MESNYHNATIEELLKEKNYNQLITELSAKCLPITLKYLKIFKKDYCIEKDEMNTYLFQALENLIKYRKDKKIYDIERYFKYLYLQVLRGELRRLNLPKHRLNRNSLSINESINIEESFYSSSDNDIPNINQKDELVQFVLSNKNSNLTNNEKEILSLFVNGFNLKEIADILDVCYSSLFRQFKNIIDKCRQFLKKTVPDLFL